jgi:tetratricopeptide (TPR) repeat protein
MIICWCALNVFSIFRGCAPTAAATSMPRQRLRSIPRESATQRLGISPNSPLVLQSVAWTLTFTGDQDRALGYFRTAIRLEAANPRIHRALTGAAAACVLAGRFAEAIEFGERARHDFAGWGPTHRFLAAAYAQTGDTKKQLKLWHSSRSSSQR